MMAATQKPIEIAGIGNASCLYRSDTGALALLNPAAREIWHRARSGDGGADVEVLTSDRATSALIEAWRRQGFLDEHSTVPPPNANPSAETLPSEPALLDQCYAIGTGRACRVTVSDRVLAGLVEAVLSPIACKDRQPCSRVDAIGRDDGTLCLIVDGERQVAGELALVRSEALRHVLLTLVGWDQAGALLHATTVAGPAGAIALIGASGSGKSTLAAELVARGWRYVADDFSALDRSANAIHPYPVGLSVKEGSWAAVGRHFPQLDHTAPLVTRRLSVRYLDLSSKAVPAGHAFPVATLVFPVFTPNAPLEATRLGPEAVLQLAIDSGSGPDGKERSIRPLVRLCNEVPAWHIAYGAAREAAQWIAEHTGMAA
jgi:hypothetical protein